ncbi:TRAP-type mannitol/chloroaromatic compound transport system permease small subunit [Rubricella aquisinus]|uniref:TRAP transporter small permease protein n=1 Tax=Rubricella aquisinus TaxID=2028108 RepID=A0A840WSG7_9RHOB|nr:TRAP transporter small permease [Rubricella aquisinus]MBB5514150.1 TRAP-type mannitol/chloroaromatic compound transport system permease small subunit [Rubricella aquisinus]
MSRDPLPLRVLDGATQGLNVIGSLLIAALMVLIGADVLGRNLMGAPLSGVPEMVTLSIVAIVFLQIPQALRAGRMTRSEAFTDMLERRAPRTARALLSLFDLAAMFVVGTIVHATWPIFTRAFERGEFVGAVGDFTAPVWPVKAMILIGGSMLVLQFLARIARRYGYGT